MKGEDKKTKVRKGWIAVRVGDVDQEDSQRFEIPISYLSHPLLLRLLDEAREIYGYHTTGPLRLPCSVDEFCRIKSHIDKESARQPLYRSMSLSFLSKEYVMLD